MDSYDVRFWDTRKIADNASGGRYRVRWAVNGQEHCKSFKTKTLADGVLDGLKDAARARGGFAEFGACAGVVGAEALGGIHDGARIEEGPLQTRTRVPCQSFRWRNPVVIDRILARP